MIYGDNEISFIQVQQISEELQSNCVQMVNVLKNKKCLGKYTFVQKKKKNVLLENNGYMLNILPNYLQLLLCKHIFKLHF